LRSLDMSRHVARFNEEVECRKNEREGGREGERERERERGRESEQ
jgi:hypothetical protein